MLPLSLRFCRKRSSSSIRTVSLTAPGIWTIQILNAVIPDMIAWTNNCFDSIDHQAQIAKVLLDMVEILENYPATSQVWHVMMLRVGAPCTHCSFWSKTCKDGPEYAYNTKMNYHSRSFSRNSSCTVEFHPSAMTKKDADYLAMKSGAADGMQESGRYPMS